MMNQLKAVSVKDFHQCFVEWKHTTAYDEPTEGSVGRRFPSMFCGMEAYNSLWWTNWRQCRSKISINVLWNGNIQQLMMNQLKAVSVKDFHLCFVEWKHTTAYDEPTEGSVGRRFPSMFCGMETYNSLWWTNWRQCQSKISIYVLWNGNIQQLMRNQLKAVSVKDFHLFCGMETYNSLWWTNWRQCQSKISIYVLWNGNKVFVSVRLPMRTILKETKFILN